MKVAVNVKGVSADQMTAAQFDTTVTYREGTAEEVINARAIKKFHTFMRKTDPEILAQLTTFTVKKITPAAQE
jgi:hypothetical protein